MLNILVVEDEPGLLRNLARFLSIEGYAVHTAVDGEEACRQMQAQPPQLLLVDQNLPGRTGIEVLRHAHETLPDLSMILMSGRLDQTLRTAAQTLGAKACLQKPFSLSELKHTLRESTAVDPGGVRSVRTPGMPPAASRSAHDIQPLAV